MPTQKINARNVNYGDIVTINVPAYSLTVSGKVVANKVISGIHHIKLDGVKERDFAFCPDDQITIHIPTARAAYASFTPGTKFRSSGNSIATYMKVNDTHFVTTVGIPTIFEIDHIDNVALTKVN